MKKLTLGLTFLLISILSTSQIINIPADYTTIQQGIYEASDGDTVLVQPGTYLENINFSGKNITVGSLFLTTQDTNYIAQTIIDGDQNGTSVVTFENSESEAAKLIGFTITNGYSSTSGGGIMCVFSSPTLHYLYIIENEAEYNGGGIICGAYANPSINNVKIINNYGGGDGGGIYCYNNCSPSIENVILSDNIADLRGGGICCLENCSPNFNQVLISNNTAEEGGGIFCAINSNLDLQDAAITSNTANTGGGIFMSENTLTLNQTTISNNSANFGGGLFAHNFSEVYLDSTDISGNIATNRGAGIYSFNVSVFHIENCSIAENEIIGGNGGGICCDFGQGLEDPPEVIIENSIFADNIGSESGSYAGAYFFKYDNEIDFNIKIKNCTFESNVARGASGLTIRGNELGFELVNCNFLSNEAEQYTAGLSLSGGCNGEIVNCLFNSNVANTGGEEWNSGALSIWNQVEVDILNCTFVNNSAFYGSALTIFASEVLMLNTIVWDNANNQITLLDGEEIGSSLVVGYSNIQGDEESIELGELSELDWAGGNIDEDPVFMNSGDHPNSLDMGSPCIDKGTPDSASVELPEGDCMGNVRVWDGDGDYIAVVDMGPYEYGSIPVNIETHGEAKNNELAAIAYPNPFITSTTIEYELTEPSFIQISIYDYLGKQHKTIEQKQQIGKQQFLWDAAGLPTGIYYCVLKTEGGTQTIKMIKLK